MSAKISELIPLLHPTGDEVLPVVKNGINYKVALKDFGSVIDRSNIGLDNVDNTRDIDKPISKDTQKALDDKADKNHTHAIADVSGLQAVLDGKAPKVHKHVVADITDFNAGVGNAVSALGISADQVTIGSLDW